VLDASGNHSIRNSNKRTFRTLKDIMPQEPKILSTEELQASEAKWVGLQKIRWQDPTGKERVWEAAARKTQSKAGLDAVVIFAQLTSASDAFKPSTVIIEQYRPPVGAVVVEFPAGLVDAEESAANAAVRELKEETGFEATMDDVKYVGPMTGADPGLTASTMKLVTIALEFPASETSVPSPQQSLDEGEFILKRVVEIDQLHDILQEYAKKGVLIDARLQHFAAGYAARKALGC